MIYVYHELILGAVTISGLFHKNFVSSKDFKTEVFVYEFFLNIL